MKHFLIIIFFLFKAYFQISDAMKKILCIEKSKSLFYNPFWLSFSTNNLFENYKLMNPNFLLMTVDNNDQNNLRELKGHLDISHLEKNHKRGEADFGVTAKPKFAISSKHAKLLKFAKELSESEDENLETNLEEKKNKNLKKELSNVSDLNISNVSTYQTVQSNNDDDLEIQNFNLILPDIFNESFISKDDDNSFEAIKKMQDMINIKGNLSEDDKDGFFEPKDFNKTKLKTKKNKKNIKNSQDDNSSEETDELFHGIGKLIKPTKKELSESEEVGKMELLELDDEIDNQDENEKVYREVFIVEIMDCEECLNDPDLVYFADNY